MPKKNGEPESIFLASFPNAENVDSQLCERWEKFMSLRQVATKALENARADKFIGNSLAAKIIIDCSDEIRSFLLSFKGSLADLFLVSGVEFGKVDVKYSAAIEEVPDMKVGVVASDGSKCERCWKYDVSVGDNLTHPKLCARCAAVLS
jgi:isoleucyl-tRNA synthetase